MSAPVRVSAGLAATAAIVASLLLFFAEPLFTAKVYSPADLVYDYPPWSADLPADYSRPNRNLTDRINQHDRWREYNRQTWARGELPLWNPHVFGGVPHLANYQSAALYPPSLLTLPLPFTASQLAVAMFHLGLAGGFMWLFVRHAGASPGAALLGAFAFMFSGVLVLWLGSPGGHVIPWLPALMYLSARFVEAPTPGIWLALYAVVALQFFGGHPESSHYLLLTAAVFVAYRLVRDRAARGTPAGLRVLGAWLAACTLGLLTAAIQILPFFEYLGVMAENAGGTGIDWSRGMLLPRPRLTSMVALVFPYAFGHPAWGDRDITSLVGVPNFNEIASVYVGLCPLLLAAWMVARWRRADADSRFFAVFAIVTLAYFYWLPPVHGALKATPLLNRSKELIVPVLSNFCVAYLAARGMDDFARRLGDARVRGRAVRALLVAALLIVVAVGIARVGLTLVRERVLETGEAHIGRLAEQHAARGPSVGAWRGVAYWRAHLQRAYGHAQWAATTPLIAAAILAAAAMLAVVAARTRRSSVLVAGVLAVTLADLFFFGVRVNASTPRDGYPLTDSIRFLQQDRSLFRIWGTNRVLLANVPMAYGLADARGYDALRPPRYQTLLLADGVLINSNLADSMPYTHYDSRALDLAGVKYVLADGPLPEPRDLDLVYEGDVLIYAKRAPLPRAWVVHEVVTSASRASALRSVLDPALDPRRTAVIEGRLAAPVAPAARPARVEIGTYEPHRVRIRVDTAAPGLLVLGDNHYPGWRAAVDGRPQPIHVANYAFRGVEVPAGTHSVEFVFDPTSVRIGGVISLTALGAAVVAGGVAARRRRRMVAAANGIMSS